MSSLSEKLRLAREQSSLSQSQVAELSGIGYKTINNYETGVSKPDVEKLAILCNIYNVSANYFIETQSDLDTTSMSIQEIQILRKYRKLDIYSKEMIDCIMDIELKRLEGMKKTQEVVHRTPKLHISRKNKLYVAARNGKSGYVQLSPDEEKICQKLYEEKFPELLNPNNEEPPDF